METKRRILLVNSWHDDNKGDSAITDGIVRLVQSAVPSAEITVVSMSEAGAYDEHATRHLSSSHPGIITVPNPIPTELGSGSRTNPYLNALVWLLRLLPSWITHIFGVPSRHISTLVSRSDLVIAVGGSNIYTDDSVNPLLSFARLYTVAAPIHAATKRGVPALLLGHTLGPFPPRRRVAHWMARRMLRGAKVVVLRDEVSLAVAHALQLDHAQVAPDMAYATHPTPTPRVTRVVDDLGIDPARTAVIAMRKHPSAESAANERVIEAISDAMGQLAAQGRLDSVLVVAHTIGPTAIEDDRDVSNALTAFIADRYPHLQVRYLDVDLTPPELAWLYGQMACMVAVRLHAAILAMILGTPIFAISYFSHKTAGVMAGVGLADHVGEFDTVTTSDIVRSISVQLDAESGRSTLAATCAGLRHELESRSAQWFSVSDSPARGTSEVGGPHA